MSTNRPPARPATPSGPTWSASLASLCRKEIDAGRMVRASIPGSPVALLIDDAYDEGEMLVIVDPQGRSYHVGHPAGVVVLCDPVPASRSDKKPDWTRYYGDE